MSIASRLKGKIAERYNGNLRDFQQAMKGTGVKGITYPTVHAYVKGTSTPSVDFLKEAAKLLGVRPAWLTLGEGAPTELEEIARLRHTRDEQDTEPHLMGIEEQVEEIIAEHFPMIERAPTYAHGVVWHTISTLSAEFMYHAEAEPDENHISGYATAAADLVARYLAAPILLYPDRVIDPIQFGQYITAACQGLLALWTTTNRAYDESPLVGSGSA